MRQQRRRRHLGGSNGGGATSTATTAPTTAATAAATATTVALPAIPTAGGPSTFFVLAGGLNVGVYKMPEVQALPVSKVSTNAKAGTSELGLHEYAGPLPYDLIMKAQPKFDANKKNDAFRKSIVVTATDGYQTAIGWGEIDPKLGNKKILLATNPKGTTPRNLLGFKDGTNNLKPGTEQFNSNVWVQPGDGLEWMRGGSYLVARRIRILLEKWDAVSLQEQERTIGRLKDSGAPIGRKAEHDAIDLSTRDAEDVRILPDTAHVRLSNQEAAGMHFLRRSYSFTDGVIRGTGELAAGLFFIAYQRDPRTQFMKINSNLSHSDALNAFTRHVGSAIFAVPPGIARGEYLGQPLFV